MEGTMLRFVYSAIVALALVAVPASMAIQNAGQARAEATTKADKSAEKGETKKEKRAKKARKKREQTQGQKEARARQKQCGQEWRDAKKAGKVDKGMTWPKYWSACNARLKGGAGKGGAKKS
jgi:hypothetical protein